MVTFFSAAVSVLIAASFLLAIFPSVAGAAETCSEGDRRVCGIDEGICKAGRSACKDGVWGECDGMIGPKDTETCGNSLDDNCDGAVDENCLPWVSFILIGMGMLFIGIGMIYIQKEKGGRMLSDGVGKD